MTFPDETTKNYDTTSNKVSNKKNIGKRRNV